MVTCRSPAGQAHVPSEQTAATDSSGIGEHDVKLTVCDSSSKHFIHHTSLAKNRRNSTAAGPATRMLLSKSRLMADVLQLAGSTPAWSPLAGVRWQDACNHRKYRMSHSTSMCIQQPMGRGTELYVHCCLLQAQWASWQLFCRRHHNHCAEHK